MSLARVRIESDVWFVCLSHALSSEREEVMGLLMGDWFQNKLGENEAHIWEVMILNRSDKRSDRVEISPEQLASAQQEAEDVSHKLGKTTRVIGWYHSHPRITVLPSHVDVRTQASYQMMDERFIGLIFACFYQDKELLNKVQVTAFQANSSQIKTPLLVEWGTSMGAGPLKTLTELPEILFSEEKTLFEAMTDQTNITLDTIHNGAVYVKSLSDLLDKVCHPMLLALEQRHNHNLRTIDRLKREKEELLAELKQL